VTEEGRPKISGLATVPIQPSQWYTLGLALGVEEEVLDRIEVEQAHKLAKCKRAMFRKWLELNPTPSWNNVIEALSSIGEQETADRVRVEFFPPQLAESHDNTMLMVAMTMMITIVTGEVVVVKMKLMMVYVIW